MLLFKLTENILEVTEVFHYWNETKYYYWYYDIVYWKKSSSGLKDGLPVFGMNQADVDLITRHYLPKVNKNDIYKVIAPPIQSIKKLPCKIIYST